MNCVIRAIRYSDAKQLEIEAKKANHENTKCRKHEILFLILLLFFLFRTFVVVEFTHGRQISAHTRKRTH